MASPVYQSLTAQRSSDSIRLVHEAETVEALFDHFVRMPALWLERLIVRLGPSNRKLRQARQAIVQDNLADRQSCMQLNLPFSASDGPRSLRRIVVCKAGRAYGQRYQSMLPTDSHGAELWERHGDRCRQINTRVGFEHGPLNRFWRRHVVVRVVVERQHRRVDDIRSEIVSRAAGIGQVECAVRLREDCCQPFQSLEPTFEERAGKVDVNRFDVANDLFLVELVLQRVGDREEARPHGLCQCTRDTHSPSIRNNDLALAILTRSFHSAAFNVAGFSNRQCLLASRAALASR